MAVPLEIEETLVSISLIIVALAAGSINTRRSDHRVIKIPVGKYCTLCMGTRTGLGIGILVLLSIGLSSTFSPY